MRYNDFKTVLLEYKREPTARSFGEKIIARIGAMPDYDLPGDLQTAKTVIGLVNTPDRYSNWGIGQKRMEFGGQYIAVGLENAREVFAQLKPRVIDSVLEELEHSDPTPNKVFVPWLAREWSNGNIRRFEDIDSRLRPLMQDFIAYKNKRDFPPQAKDIMRLSATQFEEVMTSYQPPPDQARARGQSKTLLDNDVARVIVPQDEEAACYYGQGTRWCTAATRGRNMFDNYSREGELYIILPKKPKHEGEKYQLHFYSEQFMDENDDPVDLQWLLSVRFPELEETFKKIAPIIDTYITFSDDSTLEGLWKLVAEYARDYATQILDDWQMNDDYYNGTWVPEFAKERGYITPDGDIDWDKVYDDGQFDFLEYNDDARRFIRDVDQVCNWHYYEIKEFAKTMWETGDTNGTPSLLDLDEMFAAACEAEVHQYGDMVAERVHAAVWVRSDFKGAEEYKKKGGRILGTVGKYTVGAMGEGR